MKIRTIVPQAVVGAMIGLALILMVAGCSSQPEEESPSVPGQEQVRGEIVTISPEEFLLASSPETEGMLQGTVRVSTTELDEETISQLIIGHEVTVHYSGQVGLSEPPFISAISIDFH